MKTLWIIIILSLFMTITIIAQDDACSAFVDDALATLDTICEKTGRNEVCYGNNLVTATYIEDEVEFAEPGDITSIANIESITTGPFVEPDEWGIAFMKLQANIPNTLPGQNVTFLLYGRAELTNSEEQSDSPMQAVYFSSDLGETGCNEVPRAGLLIQTPEFDEPIELMINDVEIRLGSTILIDAELNHAMWIRVLEGFAVASYDIYTVYLPEGSMVWFPIDEGLHTYGAPNIVLPYEIEKVQYAPVDALDDPITIADPASEEDIAAANHPIVGTWVGEWEGSNITISFMYLGDGLYDYAYYDDFNPQPCGGAASADGQGVLEDNTITIENAMWACVDESASFGPHVLSFTYDPASDTLNNNDTTNLKIPVFTRKN